MFSSESTLPLPGKQPPCTRRRCDATVCIGLVFVATLLVPRFSWAQSVSRADYTVGTQPNSIATTDFNLDGHLDLVTANFDSNSISVLPGVGGGRFGTHVDFSTGASSPYSVAVGDFNGDGYPDAVTANNFGNGASVFINDGGTTFFPHVDYSTGLSPTAVAVGDFNGDHKLDIAVADLCDEPEFCSNGTVSILLGNGDGTFGPAHIFPEGTRFGGNPTSITVADLNGDGKLDLVLANWEALPSEFTVSVLLGNGDGTFQASQDYLVGTNPRSAAVGDFNGDGKPDIVSANWHDNTISLLLGNGDGTFQPQVVFPANTNPWWIVAGDFNGDGKLDVLVTNNNNNEVSLLLGSGTGTFSSPVSFATGSSPVSVVAADFDHNGTLDAAIANYYGNSVSVLLNDGP